MCGIFGYVGTDLDAGGLVLRALKQLEYRGYDSWGVAVAHDRRVVLQKQTGKIGEATATLPPSTVGLGHTRWATHGGVTQPNAHPHVDCAGRLALVHNGIVANYRELRDPLTRSGHRFRSDTDTEVITHVLEDRLGFYASRKKRGEFQSSVRNLPSTPPIPPNASCSSSRRT
jgi:glucosamine--fructose-6-phosphate aminotransferase (isomerizing)